jgi:long-chain fatty acid transport protein
LTFASDPMPMPWSVRTITKFRLPLLGALVCGLAATGTVQAQGFGLNEIGSCAVARGFAVTGATCHDASVIYWNPAAAAWLPGKTLTIGGALIAVSGGFRQDTTNRRYTSDVPKAYPPHLFATYGQGPWSIGLGVYVPYGLTSQWKPDFPGRFSALKASLQTVYVQPNFAYAITPNWSIGGGPVYGYSKVELIQSVDLADQVASSVGGIRITFGQLGIPAQTEFARGQLKGSASAWGVNLGIQGHLTPEWTVGARYLSELKFKYDDADATFTQIPTGLILAPNNPLSLPAGSLDAILAGQFDASSNGALVAQKAKSSIAHPWQAQIGVGYTGFPGTTLSFDLARIGWSAFDKLPVEFEGAASGNNQTLIEDYKDSWSYRAGVEHTIQSPGTWQGWLVRGGFSYAQTPAPDATVTPLLPDMNRTNLSIGLGIPFRDNLRLDASYLHVSTPGRRGRIAERTSELDQVMNSGAYDLSANVLSLTLTATF